MRRWRRTPAPPAGRKIGTRPALLESDKWIDSDLVLELISIVGTRPYPLDELMLMTAAMAYEQPRVVIEIGTHRGVSARVWYELARRLGLETAIHTIELNDPGHVEYPGTQLGKLIRGLPVDQHFGDGALIAAELIARHARDDRILLYIDGDHERASVLRCLRAGAAIQRGCILVHDTFLQPSSAYNHGPYLAIEDALPELQPRQVLHLQTGLPGMSYIGLRT